MWHNLTDEELKTLQRLFPEKSIVGGLSGQYMLFKCTSCGEEVDLSYEGWEGMVPYFTFKCRKCGSGGPFKVNPAKVHELPRKPD